MTYLGWLAMLAAAFWWDSRGRAEWRAMREPKTAIVVDESSPLIVAYDPKSEAIVRVGDPLGLSQRVPTQEERRIAANLQRQAETNSSARDYWLAKSLTDEGEKIRHMAAVGEPMNIFVAAYDMAHKDILKAMDASTAQTHPPPSR